MFNPANLANEVFGILRSFDYVVNIFDFDGNRVYEPSEARRFFASPKNITVSIHEDGENSTIKMFLSKSTDVSEVSGLISTMRTTASKFGVLFNVRKYERELKPKDLAPNGASDFDTSISLSSNESDKETGKAAELDFEKHVHTPEDEQLDRINDEVSTLTKDFKEIVGLLRNKKVKEAMIDNNETLNESEGQTVHLNAFDMDVEADAWELFKKGQIAWSAGQRPQLSVGDDEIGEYQFNYSRSHGVEIDHDSALRSVRVKRIINALKDTAPKLGAVLAYCLDRFTAGNAEKLVTMMLDRAVEATVHGTDGDRFHDVDDAKGKTDKALRYIHVKEFRGQVEREAWQDFTNEHIDLADTIDFSALKFGPTANKLALMLHLVAEKTLSPGLGNLFSQFATDIEDGRSTPFKVKVAKHAIEIAKHGKVEVGESVIMTESIKEFADWFDSLSSVSVFENYSAEVVEDVEEAIDLPAIDNEAEEEAVEQCKCIDECHCNEELELSTEDVLLPSRADDDFSKEVLVPDEKGDDLDRIITLARGHAATYSPRTPQP